MSSTTTSRKSGGNSSSNALSDSDDSAVVVTHDDAASPDDATPPLVTEETAARAVQIVSIGGENDAYAFSFAQEKMKAVLDLVPSVGTKVAVLSVVGAFRTGKSFLLSWFLRYLHHMETQQESEKGTGKTKETPWYRKFDSLGNDGFEWKAGSERNTTGIWMWSKPFLLQRKDEEPLAVLLVDTQGMFDHETTMGLTASIFGFSTLLSSFQIYNVDKRIQEDHLQQLALFSEYARIAVNRDDHKGGSKKDSGDIEAPFQHVEFLVRDWQHFEEEEESIESMVKSMGEYLTKVLQEREAADLKDTREQIMACFEELTCYGLPHPGFAVTKKKFTGDVDSMEELFVKLLDNYCQRIFETVQPKKIHGRTLTAVELSNYITAYADLFATGAEFPQAVTMLEATTSANNTNAVQLGILEYKTRMDRVVGPHCTNYLKKEELEEEHAAAVAASLNAFCGIANFGSDKAIAAAKQKLQDAIHESYEIYASLNDGRNPFKDMDLYLIAVAIGVAAYLIQNFLHFTCPQHSGAICKGAHEFLSHSGRTVFIFLLIIGLVNFRQIVARVHQFQQAWDMLASGGGKAKAD